jgi:hypothetical protein
MASPEMRPLCNRGRIRRVRNNLKASAVDPAPVPLRRANAAALNDLSPGSVDNSVGNAGTIILKRPLSRHFCSLPKVCAVRKPLKSLAIFLYK